MKKINNYNAYYRYIEPLTDDDPNLAKKYQISNCFQYLEDYLNIAANQLLRIQKTREALDALPEDSDKLHSMLVILFGDVHFLLNAMEKCYLLSIRLIGLLNHKNRIPSIKHSCDFLSVKNIRNYLEHMDEKLTAKDAEHNDAVEKSGWYTNWFSRQWNCITDNRISLGEYSFDISETSLKPLFELYDEISSYIYDAYVIPNMETVERIFVSKSQFRKTAETS